MRSPVPLGLLRALDAGAPTSEGGFFNATMSFPLDYPSSPPCVRFVSEMWHPNVYPDGKVCISILHSPGDDPHGCVLHAPRRLPGADPW